MGRTPAATRKMTLWDPTPTFLSTNILTDLRPRLPPPARLLCCRHSTRRLRRTTNILCVIPQPRSNGSAYKPHLNTGLFYIRRRSANEFLPSPAPGQLLFYMCRGSENLTRSSLSVHYTQSGAHKPLTRTPEVEANTRKIVNLMIPAGTNCYLEKPISPPGGRVKPEAPIPSSFLSAVGGGSVSPIHWKGAGVDSRAEMIGSRLALIASLSRSDCM